MTRGLAAQYDEFALNILNRSHMILLWLSIAYPIGLGPSDQVYIPTSTTVPFQVYVLTLQNLP